jgi:uncharacterized protein
VKTLALKSFVATLLLLSFFTQGQSHPLELANSASETYPEVWKNATLQDVEAWLQTGVDLNQRDTGGMTALMWAAAFNDDPNIIKALVAAGADINASDNSLGMSVLDWSAASTHNPEIIKTIVSLGSTELSDGEPSTFMMAATTGNPDIIATLVELGGNINATDSFGITPLIFALNAADDTAGIAALLNAGAETEVSDFQGLTPLAYSVQGSGTEKLELLLNAGANVNFVGSLGMTSLMAAAASDNLEALQMLLALSADVNTQLPSSGLTALMLAAKAATKPEIVLTLLNAGADARLTDVDGKTALDYANENPALANTEAHNVLESMTGTPEERAALAAQNAFTMGDTKTGDLKARSVAVVKFEVAPDLPRGTTHEFEVSVTGDIQGFVTILDPEGEEVYAQYVFPNAPLKVSEDFRTGGTYTLRLAADRGEGTFTITSFPLEVITESSDGFQGVLTLGEEVSGTIASSYDLPIYHIKATEGVPIAFRIMSNPETTFSVTAQPVGLDYGLLGVRPDEEGRLIFAPEMTTTYEIVLNEGGAETPIRYTIVAEGLEGFSQAETTLLEGSPVTGEVTASVTHVYEFEGAPPSSEGARGVRISATGATPLSYSIHVSGEGSPLNELRGTLSPGESKTIRMAGTGSMGAMIGRKKFLLEAGTFELRITSNEGAASYEVALERVP